MSWCALVASPASDSRPAFTLSSLDVAIFTNRAVGMAITLFTTVSGFDVPMTSRTFITVITFNILKTFTFAVLVT